MIQCEQILSELIAFKNNDLSLKCFFPYIFEFLGGNGHPENIPQPQQAEKSNQFSGRMAFTNLNEPNVNAIIVYDGVLLKDGMRTVMS